jgi:hypothetical protein
VIGLNQGRVNNLISEFKCGAVEVVEQLNDWYDAWLLELELCIGKIGKFVIFLIDMIDPLIMAEAVLVLT